MSHISRHVAQYHAPYSATLSVVVVVVEMIIWPLHQMDCPPDAGWWCVFMCVRVSACDLASRKYRSFCSSCFWHSVFRMFFADCLGIWPKNSPKTPYKINHFSLLWKLWKNISVLGMFLSIFSRCLGSKTIQNPDANFTDLRYLDIYRYMKNKE